MTKYSESIMQRLRQRIYLEEDDTSRDDKLERYSPDKVFEECLEWEGIIGYDRLISQIIKDIYGFDLTAQSHHIQGEWVKRKKG
jgi:hypothetical protein